MNPMRIIGEATHTVTPWLEKALYKVNKADGVTITLPKATGSGFAYKFILGVDVTSDAVVQVASADDVMAGQAVAIGGADDSTSGWETAAASDTITLNGSTTGGKKGDVIELIDIAEGEWAVHAVVKQTGIEATPFSAAV